MVSVETRQIIGIDVGSRSIELVLLEAGHLVHQAKLPTTFDPLAQCRRMLDGLPPALIVATGYGRRLLVKHLKHRRVMAITEIQAYAWGRTTLILGCAPCLISGARTPRPSPYRRPARWSSLR
jgi:activator of 2-hydroxyglutaryl-CoA dehydratase